MKKLFSILFLLFCLKSFGQTGQYTFTLASQSHTSAGVYKLDSTLVRTLWSDSVLAAGTYTRYWDGKDDFGNTITSPAATYDIRVVSNNVNYNWDGIIGNTSTNNTGSTVHKGYYVSMTGMAITGTTAYFCQGYSEGYSSQAKFSTSNPQVRLDLNGFGGRQSTMNCNYVATDGINVYWAGYNAYQLLVSSIVTATAVSNDAQISFGANGTSYTMTSLTNAKTYTSVIDLITTDVNGRPTGMAVQNDPGTFLFVAHGGLNRLTVKNKTSGTQVQNLTVANPRNISIEGNYLWMVSGTNTVAKYVINANGTLSPAVLTLSGITTPGAIAVNNGNIAVIDAGTNQIVRFYNTTTGVQGTQLGTTGGYFTYASVTNTKFFFDDYRGNKYGFLAFVPNDGSLWVGDPGNYRELHFSVGSAPATLMTDVATGEYSTQYLKSDGTAWVTHEDTYDNAYSPAQIAGLTSIAEMDGGQYTSVYRGTNGNAYSSVGGAITSTAYLTDYNNNAFTCNKIYAMWRMIVAIKNGEVWYWSAAQASPEDMLQQFGPLTTPVPKPRKLIQPSGKTIIKCVHGAGLTPYSGAFLWGLASDGTLWQWDQTHTTPFQVLGKTGKSNVWTGNVIDVAANFDARMVFTSTGQAWVWGYTAANYGGHSDWENADMDNIASNMTGAGISFPLKQSAANYLCIQVIDANNNKFGIGNNQTGSLGSGYMAPSWRTNWNGASNAIYTYSYSNYDGNQATWVQQPGKWSNIKTNTSFVFYSYGQDIQGNWYSWGRNKAQCLGQGVTYKHADQNTYPDWLDIPSPRLVNPISQVWTVQPSVNITQARSPIASAGINQYISGTSTTLYGDQSHQNQPSNSLTVTMTNAWTQVTGPNTATIVSPTSQNTSVSGLISGTYVFRNTVTNSVSATDYQEVSVGVSTGSYQFVEYIMSLGANYEVYADPNDATRVFAGGLAAGGIVEFKIDYSQPLTGNSGWTLVNNWGANVANNMNYHKSLRFPTTLSNGRTYAFIRKSNGVTNTVGGATAEFVELPSSGQVRFTGLTRNVDFVLAPDGAIQDVTSANIGGTSTLGRYALTGFNGSNNPLWSGTREALATISGITANDPYNSRVLSNNVITASNKVLWWNPRIYAANGSTVDTGYHLGVMARGGSSFKFKTEQGTHINYTGAYPGPAAYEVGNGVHDNSGGTVSTVDGIIITSYHGEFWKNYQTNYYNQYDQYGLAIGQFGSDQYIAGGASTASAGSAGNALTPMLVKNASNNYFMYHGDESDHGGLHRWSISNLSSIAAQTTNINFPSSYVAPALGYVDLHDGLPFDSALPTSVGWSKTGTVNSNTNRKKYQNDGSPDVYTTFAQSTGTAAVNRDLGTNNVTTTWKISGFVTFEGSDYTTGSKINSYVDVLDDAGKILARFYYTFTSPTLSIKGNTATISSPAGTSNLNKLSPLTIECVNGVITFTYANYAPVSDVIYDGTGNWHKPTTLRQYWTTGGTPAYGKNIGFYNMRLYTDASIPTVLTRYYFSNSGNDNNAGTIGSPYKTIDKFNAIFPSLNAGDTLSLKGGDRFYGSITISKSGTAGSPIVINSYGTGNAILTSMDTIKTGASIGANKWQSSIISSLPGTTANMVVVNNVQVGMGRYPNLSGGNKGYLNIDGIGTNSVTLGWKGNITWEAGTELVLRAQRWKINRCPIVSQSNNTITFTPVLGAQGIVNYGAFFQNSISTLDQDFEWYHDVANNRMIMYGGANPFTNNTVEVAKLDNGIYSNGFDNIIISNLTIRGYNNYGVYWRGGDNIYLNNSNILFSGKNAVNVANTMTNFYMYGDSIDYSASGAIYFKQVDGGFIKNCYINHSGFIAGMGESDSEPYRAITTGSNATNYSIENNTILNSGSSAITASGNNWNVTNNFIDSTELVKDDQGSIYVQDNGGEVRHDRLINYNIVLNGIGAKEGVNTTAQKSNGIYMDDNANNVVIEGNTISNQFNGLTLHQAYNIKARNNTIFNCGVALFMQRDHATFYLRNDTVTNNIFFNTNGNQVLLMYNQYNYQSPFNAVGIIDTNYYIAPNDITKVLSTSYNSATVPYSNLTQWRSDYPNYDFSSKESPVRWATTVNVLDSVRFEYNKTAAPVTVYLDSLTYVDSRGVRYDTNYVTIPAFGSWIGLRTGNVPLNSGQGPVDPPPTPNPGTNKMIFNRSKTFINL